MVIMDIWKIKIGLGPNCQKSFWNGIFVLFKLLLNEHVLKIFTLSFIHMDFVNIFCNISQWHPSWQMTLTTFDIGFDLGLGGLINGWTFASERLQY